MSKIPNDLILIISGVSCVGKTTAAYNILKKHPCFKRVSELDVFRALIRSTIEEFEEEYNCIDDNIIKERYESLFKSITYGDLKTMKEQSNVLLNYIRIIVKRQQSRKIPTIIEGQSIVPSVFFNNFLPVNGFQKNIVFVNLYLSDEMIHTQRRVKRCIERKYNENYNITKEKISRIRYNKSYLLHQETLLLSNKINNVFSIDITNLNEEDVVEEIMCKISSYLYCNK